MMWIAEEIKRVYYTVLWLRKASPSLPKGFPAVEETEALVLFPDGPGTTASKFFLCLFQQLGPRLTTESDHGSNITVVLVNKRPPHLTL